MSSWHIKKAACILNSGGVIAYPTEAVYGLGCQPWNAEAVARVLTLKRRDPGRGLIVIAADLTQLEALIDLESGIPMAEISRTWPGPVTWVMPARKEVPHWLMGKHGGLAVRVTAHPIARELCRYAGPLVSTSANPEGRTPARTAYRVRAYFHNEIDWILPGRLGSHLQPTEIRLADTGEVLRRTSG